MDEKTTAKFLISGTVQGVGFRYFVYQNARPLGITGYAKNLADGRVEVIAEGNTADVKELEKKLKQGPGNAHVDNVRHEFEEYRNKFSGFDIY
ncbi:MAG: acylphosphatase [Bacteroidota bacterium]